MMSASWYHEFFFLFSLPFNLQLIKLSKPKKAPMWSTPGYLRLHSSVDPKEGGLDLKGGCEERRVVTVAGPHSTQHWSAGRGDGGWRARVGVCPATREPHCSLWEEMSVTMGLIMEREEGRQPTEGKRFLLSVLGFWQEDYSWPLPPPTSPKGSTLPGCGHSQSPSAKHSPHSSLLPYPFFPARFFFLCVHSQPQHWVSSDRRNQKLVL